MWNWGEEIWTRVMKTQNIEKSRTEKEGNKNKSRKRDQPRKIRNRCSLRPPPTVAINAVTGSVPLPFEPSFTQHRSPTSCPNLLDLSPPLLASHGHRGLASLPFWFPSVCRSPPSHLSPYASRCLFSGTNLTLLILIWNLRYIFPSLLQFY